MSNSEQNWGSSIPIDPQCLPEELRSIGVAYNFDHAKPELQQKLVDELHDGMEPSCTTSEKEATEQLISELLAKASPTVTQHELNRADQDLEELLTQVDSDVRIRLEGLLRRRNAAIASQAKRQAESALRKSSGPKRRARSKVTAAEIVQAVAGLDMGDGVTNAQVATKLGVSRPSASNLLKAATQSGNLISTEPKAGVSTMYRVPEQPRPTTTSNPNQEGDSV